MTGSVLPWCWPTPGPKVRVEGREPCQGRNEGGREEPGARIVTNPDLVLGLNRLFVTQTYAKHYRSH